MWRMILILIGLIILGLIKNIIDLIETNKELEFVEEFCRMFNKVVDDALNKKKINNTNYEWLVSHSDKMQIILGSVGLISYKQFNMVYNNVPIILNFVNNIVSMMNDPFFNEDDAKQIEWCTTSLLRKKGILEDLISKIKKQIFNPINDLNNGIKLIINIPFELLNSVGLLSNNSKDKIERNFIITLISGLGSLLTIVSTIMTIFVGWDEFIKIIKNLF